jgi:anti-anti-sigma factor
MVPTPDDANLRVPSGSNDRITSTMRNGATPSVVDRAIQCTYSIDDSAICFALCGDFDIFNRDKLAAALTQGVAYPTLAVDFTRTTYIDASILGVLVGLAGRRQASNAAPIRIFCGSDQIRKLFAICELESMFDIRGELAAATSARSA